MTNKITKFLPLLEKLAARSGHSQHQMSCVIVQKNRVVSFGWNSVKTHTRSTARYNMLHSEVAALLGNDYNVTKGATAYVFRRNKLGCLSNAKPCDGCMVALKQSGIKRVVYTNNNSWDSLEVA